jgi:zona occludens toxin (predicted ATPase)
VITLLTGAPGAGKTALLVEWLRTIYADRPIYVHGLNGLLLPHQPVDANRWHLDVPDGALVVIDEVQQVWRPRGPGHAPAESVKELETHRHRGIDFVITTQKPNLVDANVRGLVGRHVHLRDTGWLGRHMYEWPECSENLAWKTCVVKRKYKLPSKAFALYKSASQHSAKVHTRSMLPLIVGGLLLASMVLVFMVYRTISSKTDKPAGPAGTASALPAQAEREGGGAGAHRAHGAAPSAQAWPVLNVSAVVKDREPYHDRGVHLEGCFGRARELHCTFALTVDGKRMRLVSAGELAASGYTVRYVAPCSVLLSFGDRERAVTCDAPAPVLERAAPAPREPAASSPTSSPGFALFG